MLKSTLNESLEKVTLEDAHPPHLKSLESRILRDLTMSLHKKEIYET